MDRKCARALHGIAKRAASSCPRNQHSELCLWAPVALGGITLSNDITKTRRSQSADPQQMPRVPRCRPKRCGQGCGGPHPARFRGIDPSCSPLRRPPAVLGKLSSFLNTVPRTVPLFRAQNKAKTVTEHHDLAARQMGDGLTSIRRGIAPPPATGRACPAPKSG